MTFADLAAGNKCMPCSKSSLDLSRYSWHPVLPLVQASCLRASTKFQELGSVPEHDIHDVFESRSCQYTDGTRDTFQSVHWQALPTTSLNISSLTLHTSASVPPSAPRAASRHALRSGPGGRPVHSCISLLFRRALARRFRSLTNAISAQRASYAGLALNQSRAASLPSRSPQPIC